MKVLIIDENEIDLFIGRKVFEHSGVNNVVTFCEYRDLITYLLNASETPACIFIDLYLPERDGFELIRKIRKLGIPHDKIKFILLSNLVSPAHTSKADALGIDFIRKPLTFKSIKKYLP